VSLAGDVPPRPTTAQAVELNGVTVLRVKGEIDVDTAARLETGLRDCLARKPPCLVIDLSDVHFFGAAGINFLIEAQRRADELDALLCVVADHRPVLRPLRLTGQQTGFVLVPRLADAVTLARRAENREIAM
jgi:anti-sigma B factor antagonist